MSLDRRKDAPPEAATAPEEQKRSSSRETSHVGCQIIILSLDNWFGFKYASFKGNIEISEYLLQPYLSDGMKHVWVFFFNMHYFV